LKVVFISIPDEGETLKLPGSGGVLVWTYTALEELYPVLNDTCRLNRYVLPSSSVSPFSTKLTIKVVTLLPFANVRVFVMGDKDATSRSRPSSSTVQVATPFAGTSIVPTNVNLLDGFITEPTLDDSDTAAANAGKTVTLTLLQAVLKSELCETNTVNS
jgi:hypothetical protein